MLAFFFGCAGTPFGAIFLKVLGIQPGFYCRREAALKPDTIIVDGQGLK